MEKPEPLFVYEHEWLPPSVQFNVHYTIDMSVVIVHYPLAIWKGNIERFEAIVSVQFRFNHIMPTFEVGNSIISDCAMQGQPVVYGLAKVAV